MKEASKKATELSDLSTVKVMAILNLNQDSFYAGSRKTDTDSIIKFAKDSVAAGASILDLGACSSRPGADIPNAKEEWNRLEPALAAIRSELPKVYISVDTFRSEIVNKAMDYQINMVNDISAQAFDPNLLETVGKHELDYVLMHMKGEPKTMQQDTSYDQDVVSELLLFFTEKLEKVKAAGIQNCYLDPGFGFGKSLEQNYQLLKRLEELKVLNQPLLVGVSRKSMIYKLLDSNPQEALNGTTAAHMIALNKGAQILRVHDVKEAVEAVKIHTFVQNQ